MEQRLLPPKKMLGKNSRSLVELRQKELELYLQTLLLQLPPLLPTPLARFLLFHLYVSSAWTFWNAPTIHTHTPFPLQGPQFMVNSLVPRKWTESQRHWPKSFSTKVGWAAVLFAPLREPTPGFRSSRACFSEAPVVTVRRCRGEAAAGRGRVRGAPAAAPRRLPAAALC